MTMEGSAATGGGNLRRAHYVARPSLPPGSRPVSFAVMTFRGPRRGRSPQGGVLMSESRATGRREFLGRSAGMGAGLWVVGSRVLARGTAPNERLNLGLIGVGGRGSANLKAVSGENTVAL